MAGALIAISLFHVCHLWIWRISGLPGCELDIAIGITRE